MEGPIISPEWLAKRLKHPDLIVLDVRMDVATNEDDDQHLLIPGARYFDLKGVFSDESSKYPNAFPSKEQFQAGARALGIGKESVIVCYDERGIFSSARARWMFRAFGHEQVYVLDGGLPGWISAGFETTTAFSKAAKEGGFVAELDKNRLVDLTFITAPDRANKTTLVDARSAGRFDGSAKEPRAGLRSGSIPGSVNVPFASLLEDGHFKAQQKVAECMRQCTEQNKELVFTCGSGVTACVLGLAHEWITGKDDYAIYDGSWTEYASEFPEVD